MKDSYIDLKYDIEALKQKCFALRTNLTDDEVGDLEARIMDLLDILDML